MCANFQILRRRSGGKARKRYLPLMGGPFGVEDNSAWVLADLGEIEMVAPPLEIYHNPGREARTHRYRLRRKHEVELYSSFNSVWHLDRYQS